MRHPCPRLLLTATMPLLGSIVQNGKLAACACVPSQSALKSVDCSGQTSCQKVTKMTNVLETVITVLCKTHRAYLAHVRQSHNPCLQRHACCAPAASHGRREYHPIIYQHAHMFTLLSQQHLKLRDCCLLKNCCSCVCHRTPHGAADVDCDRDSVAPVCIAAVKGRLCVPCRCLTAPQLLHVLLTYVWSCIDLCILLETLGRRRFTV